MPLRHPGSLTTIFFLTLRARHCGASVFTTTLSTGYHERLGSSLRDVRHVVPCHTAWRWLC